MEEFRMKREWKHLVGTGLLNLVLVSSLLSVLPAQEKSQDKAQKQPAPMKLKVGDAAPDFTLLAFDGKELKKVSLRDYRGKKNVALAFFVFAFTGG
jgi:cytochrome oxidase Cu insertion factor (SCO1/SenC/PrrC family)